MPQAVLIVLWADFAGATSFARAVVVRAKRVNSTNNYIAEHGLNRGSGVHMRATRKQYVVV